MLFNMKKKLLFLSVLALSLNVFGQAYTYLPYNGTPYSFPDGLAKADLDAASTETSDKTYVGLTAQDFDKVLSTSTYDSDLNKTCGLNVGSGSEAGGAITQIRGWALDFVSNPELAPFGWNAGPGIFRKGGGWYMYTVAFSEASQYDMYLRVRGTNPDATNHIYTITIYDKNNMSTSLKEWSLNLQGMDMENFGSFSSDGKALSFCDGRNGSTGQVGCIWVKIVNDAFTSEIKDYVIKISHGGTTSNTGFGSFTFLPYENTPTEINGTLIEGANIYMEGSVIKVLLPEDMDGTISLYDISGKKVMEDKLLGCMYSNELSELKGIYIVKIATDKGVMTKKLIIKK